MKSLQISLIIMLMLAMGGCSSARKSDSPKPAADTATVAASIAFNADSAYAYTASQCAFGPRVPNTEAHRLCGDYLAAHLARFGRLTEQRATLTAFDGTVLNARNIICEINPDSARRILLLAHWDCRPWADNDPIESNRRRPVPGANDGASGVAVLMELARMFAQQPPRVGVDILLVDAEDWGQSNAGDDDQSWALGTQYWCRHKHRPDYQPMFGILLDMVGTRNARFPHEYFSAYHAPQILEIVWDEARKAGYGDFFVNRNAIGVTDDHIYINEAGIPCIDIIDLGDGTSFFDGWHTTADDINVISAETLEAVGSTVAKVIYRF